MIIAIDGPAGSGKTTVAKLLASRLGILYLDTGATYRALTLKALKSNANLGDPFALRELAKNLNLKIKDEKIFIDGEDASEAIRNPLIDKNISLVVAFAEVREIMVDLQKRIAGRENYVVEGRDVTTVVFPQAEYKFYLDADFLARTQRRYKELKEKGIHIDCDETKKDLKRRDEADKGRKVGPLQLSPDATYIDTTELTIEEVVEKLIGYIK